MMLSLYFLFCLVMALAYVLAIAKIHSGWSSLKELQIPKDHKPSLHISVVIAARNEAGNIQKCVHSILDNNYPKNLFELIVVNDHSDDQTAEILQSIDHPQLIILHQEDGSLGKKEALKKGIAHAQGEIILTTDADCIARKNWISSIAYAYELTSIDMATAPVVFNKGTSAIENFQVLDLAGMMAVTAAGIYNQSYFLANGANMSFRKSAFIDLNGFEGNEQYASGDDMFLIHKMAKANPDKVAFIKTTAGTIDTMAETSLNDLRMQRKRWATKSKAYSDRALQRLLAFIFLFNALLIFNLLASPFLGEFYFFIFILLAFIKGTIDYLFLKNMTSYFDRRKAMKSFFPASILAVVNILYSGWVSVFSKTYTWKGRQAS